MIKSLSIVYPMFNERENISTAVSEALRVGYTITPELEIVIVDDASTDGCGAIANQLALDHPEVKVRHHLVNRKLGGSLRTGFAAASNEWVLYMDSDLPIKMDDATNAVPLTHEADLVIGWRKSRAESWKRDVMSSVYNWMIRRLFGLNVRDVNFAFKLFRRELLDGILLTSEGSFIDAELLLEMKRIGARIKEIGLDYYPRVAGVSTLASNKVVFVILGEMVRYRMEAHGRANDSFGGERRRLWLEQRNQSGDQVGVL
ncbi:MAG TPA: glycosyltransferase family 2 protein [Terracidiphilus sp.]|nr:glycosyltransferase family 2 protein [Terracidiphilus sp.]